MTIQVKFKRVFEYFFLINYATSEMKSQEEDEERKVKIPLDIEAPYKMYYLLLIFKPI